MTQPRDATGDVTPDVTADVRAAYDATGAAWDGGPRRIYDQLAAVLLDACPVSFDARRRPRRRCRNRRGGRRNDAARCAVTAIDLSVGMLRRMSGAGCGW